MDEVEFRPRINHVAFSVDAAVLDEAGRKAVLDFFSEVFGWTEGDNSTESGNPLILYTGQWRQYVYLLPSTGSFLVAPELDHIGLEVGSVAEIEAILERAEAYRAKDDRVRVTGIHSMTTHGAVDDYTLTNGYISFLLPLQIELQHIALQQSS